MGEPTRTTALLLTAWRWLSRMRPPASIGFGGVLHAQIPATAIDHWLDRYACLPLGDPYRALLWDLITVMDDMYLEHQHQKAQPKEEEGSKD